MDFIGIFIGCIIFTFLFIWLPVAVAITYYLNEFYVEDAIPKKIDNGKRRNRIANILSICFVIYISAILFFLHLIPR